MTPSERVRPQEGFVVKKEAQVNSYLLGQTLVSQIPHECQCGYGILNRTHSDVLTLRSHNLDTTPKKGVRRTPYCWRLSFNHSIDWEVDIEFIK